MKVGGATRPVRVTATGKSSFVRNSRARLALLALLVVGTLASGAQAQPDESSGSSTTSSSQSAGASPNSFIVTFSAGTSDAAARALLASQDGTVDSQIAPLRMYTVTLPSALSAATL